MRKGTAAVAKQIGNWGESLPSCRSPSKEARLGEHRQILMENTLVFLGKSSVSTMINEAESEMETTEDNREKRDLEHLLTWS